MNEQTVISTPLVDISFDIRSDVAPYNLMSDEEYVIVWEMLSRIALGMATLLSSIIHYPANGPLLQRIVRTTTDMIRDELDKASAE